jgi:hypothetical protein
MTILNTLSLIGFSIFLIGIHVYKINRINKTIKDIIVNRIKEQISLENLELLEEHEVTKETLHKLLVFQEEFADFETWENFKENYYICNNCNNYVDDQCICYTNK